MRISKKKLLDLADNLDACKLSSGIYYYEVDIYNLQHKDWNKLPKNTYERLKEYVDKVECIHVYADVLAYSAGVYGNIGRIDKITIKDKESWNTLDVFYVYY